MRDSRRDTRAPGPGQRHGVGCGGGGGTKGGGGVGADGEAKGGFHEIRGVSFALLFGAMLGDRFLGDCLAGVRG